MSFFEHLLLAISADLNSALQGRKLGIRSLFNLDNTIVSLDAKKSVFHLCLADIKLSSTDSGLIEESLEGGKVLMLRPPSKLEASMKLSSGPLSIEQNLESMEKLSNYFFDRRSVEMIYPPNVQSIKRILDTFKSSKAKLELQTLKTEANDKSICCEFKYTGLYHSGNGMREDHRVLTRNIDYQI